MKFLFAFVLMFFFSNCFSQDEPKYKVFSFDYVLEYETTLVNKSDKFISYSYINSKDNSFSLSVINNKKIGKDSVKLSFHEIKNRYAHAKVSEKVFKEFDTINFKCSYSKDTLDLSKKETWKYVKIKDTIVNNGKVSKYQQSNLLNTKDFILLKEDVRFKANALPERTSFYQINEIPESGYKVYQGRFFSSISFKNKREKRRYLRKTESYRDSEKRLISITKIIKYVAIKIDCD